MLKNDYIKDCKDQCIENNSVNDLLSCRIHKSEAYFKNNDLNHDTYCDSLLILSTA